MIKFENELNLIKNPFCRAFAQYCVDHINERFFEEAASTTGKYHPQYALGRGGLYRHTCAAVQIAESLMQLDCIKEDTAFEADTGSFTHDVAILALIMHDTCKCGKNWDNQYTQHTHPTQARDFVNDLALQMISEGEIECPEFIKDYAAEVGSCIASHMGQWNSCKWDYAVLPKPETNLEKFVHVCDYLASRKFLIWDYDKDKYDPEPKKDEY